MTSLQIEYFLTLAEFLNFTATANSLHISQPVVSKQIAALEEELGFQLFSRNHRQLKLTPSGVVMRDFFSRSLDEFKEFRNQAIQLDSKYTSAVSIYLINYFDSSPILDCIDAFRKDHPDTDFYIEKQLLPCSTQQLMDEQWDVAFTFADIARNVPGYDFLSLQQTSDLLVISKKHPLASKPDLCPADFSGEIFCHTTKDKSTLSDRFERSNRLALYGLDHCRRRAVSNMSSVLTNVETGSVFSILEGSVAPYISFDYIALELSEKNDVGVAVKSTSGNALVNSFIQRLMAQLDK